MGWPGALRTVGITAPREACDDLLVLVALTARAVVADRQDEVIVVDLRADRGRRLPVLERVGQQIVEHAVEPVHDAPQRQQERGAIAHGDRGPGRELGRPGGLHLLRSVAAGDDGVDGVDGVDTLTESVPEASGVDAPDRTQRHRGVHGQVRRTRQLGLQLMDERGGGEAGSDLEVRTRRACRAHLRDQWDQQDQHHGERDR